VHVDDGVQPLVVEEQFVPVSPQHRTHRRAHHRLVRRIAGDEVFHAQPAAEHDAAQADRVTPVVDEAVPHGAGTAARRTS
jgi:hypothetical protein